MAVPEGVTAVYNNVVISVYGGGGLGIRGGTPNALVGTVYKIGSNVYNVGVSQIVGFLRTEAFFATESGDTFITVPKDDILITYDPFAP